jgi:hypothetical protein
MEFDREAIRAARQTDLVSFLQSAGYSLRKEGKNYRVQGFSGVLVKDNMYTDFVHNTSGNAVDFCQRVLGMSFRESIQALNQHEKRVSLDYNPLERKREQTIVLPERADNYKRVIAYLTRTRGIPNQLVQEMIKQKLLYQDTKGNAVFVCRDENGEAKGAIIRGTLTGQSFKQRVGSGLYPFVVLPSEEEKHTLTVTEAPIESLSLMTLHPESKRTIHVALGGLHFEEAVERLLTVYPEVRRLVLALNRDLPGIQAANRFLKRFGLKMEVVGYLPQAHVNDWNEQLLSQQKESGAFAEKKFEGKARKLERFESQR